MRQIAEFVAVLSCSLFTGAAVYVSLVEHPARMQCGCGDSRYRVSAQLSSSHSHAGDLSSLGSAVVHRGVARRGDTLVAACRSPAGQRHPVYPDRDSAHQQAVAQPSTGSAVSRSRAPARTLGAAALGEKRDQRIGAAALPVLSDLPELCILSHP